MDDKISTIESLSSSTRSEDHLNDTCVSAKLRRLKIQEEILTASANKTILKCDTEQLENNYVGNSDLRKYLFKVKKAYSEIKNLFQDIKLLTKDQENFKNTDIDDIKKDILELDDKIVALKDFICKEMCLLQVAEKEIMLQIQEKPEMKLKLQYKVQAKPFNQVVPSPVRALIKSPFKCMEVQKFQDFMKNSKRYGGWNEYNHNIFVSIWNKYYKPNEIINKLDEDDPTYVAFKDEVWQKIFGIKPDDIFSHCQWYLEYIHLKRCQEAALNKWRENKRKIKNPKPNKSPEVHNITNKTSNRKLYKKQSNICVHNQESAKLVSEMEDLLHELYLSDSNSETLGESYKEDEVSENLNSLSNSQESTQKQDIVSHLYNPTKQWKNRCQKTKTIECGTSFLNVEEIKRLKIPTWRLDLHK